MSSTAVKKAKAKTVARTKTKQSLAEHDATPTSPSKARKPKPLTKGEEHTDKTKSKPEQTERATSTEETHHKTISDTRDHAKRATRPGGRRLRGPWRVPSSSPSPSLSPTSDLEDEPEVPQAREEEEEGSADEENVHLYGFSTDEDSSDDDLDVDDEAVLDVGSLPTVARDDATVKRKLERAKQKPVRNVSSHYASRAVSKKNPPCLIIPALLRYQKRV